MWTEFTEKWVAPVKVPNQTKCIDDIECPYCGHKFDGRNAVNGDMDCMDNVECPKCNKEMSISISVEYMATAYEEEE